MAALFVGALSLVHCSSFIPADDAADGSAGADAASDAAPSAAPSLDASAVVDGSDAANALDAAAQRCTLLSLDEDICRQTTARCKSALDDTTGDSVLMPSRTDAGASSSMGMVYFTTALPSVPFEVKLRVFRIAGAPGRVAVLFGNTPAVAATTELCAAMDAAEAIVLSYREDGSTPLRLKVASECVSSSMTEDFADVPVDFVIRYDGARIEAEVSSPGLAPVTGSVPISLKLPVTFAVAADGHDGATTRFDSIEASVEGPCSGGAL